MLQDFCRDWSGQELAGYNIVLEIERVNYANDDEIGGAITTGTVVHSSVYGRLQGEPPEMLLLAQGLETDRMFVLEIANHWDIRERDYARVTFPTDHSYYNVNLRIMGIVYSSFTGPRKYMLLTVTRDVRAHTIQ
jgi:hypothetical protein